MKILSDPNGVRLRLGDESIHVHVNFILPLVDSPFHLSTEDAVPRRPLLFALRSRQHFSPLSKVCARSQLSNPHF
jgi:hypothetical protein